MHEEVCQRNVHPVADQAADAGGIIALPLRVNGQRDLDGPAGHRAGGQQQRVAHCFVTRAAPVEHPRQHRHVKIGVIIDLHFTLARVQPVQAAHILCDRPSPRYRQREEQRVQPWLVEALADVTASGQQRTPLVVRHLRQRGHRGLDLLPAHAALEGNHVRNCRRQLRRQKPQMFRALRQHQWKTTRLHRGDYVPADQLVAARILGQRLVEPLELDSRIGCCEVRRAKARRANQDVMSERPKRRLLPGVDAVAHRAALHENDRVMAVLARDRGGEAGDVACLGTAGDQFKAARREMVALIHHQVAVRSNTVMHDTLPHQALDEGHVDPAGEASSGRLRACRWTWPAHRERRPDVPPIVPAVAGGARGPGC